MNNIKDNLQIINQINNKYPNLISQSNSKKLDIMYKHLDSNNPNINYIVGYFKCNEGRGYTNEQEKKYGIVYNYNESDSDQTRSILKGLEILKLEYNE